MARLELDELRLGESGAPRALGALALELRVVGHQLAQLHLYARLRAAARHLARRGRALAALERGAQLGVLSL